MSLIRWTLPSQANRGTQLGSQRELDLWVLKEEKRNGERGREKERKKESCTIADGGSIERRGVRDDKQM